MPLREHLVELRNRIVISVVAVLVGAVAGWFLYDPVYQALVAPLRSVAESSERPVQVNFGSVSTSFNLKIQVSLWLGAMVASPVWIFQLWSFITPGLTRKERWYAFGFAATAVPLFAAGLYIAYLVLPNAVVFLTSFTPDGEEDLASNIIEVSEYITFVTRTSLAFGVAFLVPVVMVGLNLAGLASGRTMLRGWRYAIVVAFLFAAIATAAPGVEIMLALAVPIIVLYFVAVGICMVNDWRRARRNGTAGLSDDEASALDDEASSLDDDVSALDDEASPIHDAPPARD